MRFPRAGCALLALFCAFCSKGKNLAGGYDDVENPAIKVSLLDTLGRPFGDGGIRVFARYQNPVKDSLPLLERAIPAGTSVGIRDSVLFAAMLAAQARGTPWPGKDTVEFNLVASAPAAEAYLGDFLMVKGAKGAFRFLRRQGGSVLQPDAKGSLEAAPIPILPVLNLRGSIGPKGLELGLKYVFIPGSPYSAKVGSDGSFSMARLAAGRYEVKALAADSKIYSAAESLSTAQEFPPTDWSEADLIWVE
ncbi:MAG: hypothetical protein JWP91_4468 [Fibrobacteres bacterium]|nr:hypothetical protein [Fibrobacterota bacterium]